MKRSGHLIAAVMLTVSPCCPLSSAVAQESAATAPQVPKVPYEAELYSLSYDVFLANGNPAQAHLLAEKALEARPRDVGWRRRAAQSGEWSGNGARAYQHWYYLAMEMKQKDALPPAFRLARALGDGAGLKKLIEQGGLGDDRQQLLEYISVCELSGLPEDAITALEKRVTGKERGFVLQQLARLYELVGRNQDAIVALMARMDQYGLTSAELLKAASLKYAAGDVAGSYAILRRGVDVMQTSEQEYWKTLGDLAWATQDLEAAEKASRRLMVNGAGREADYQRLVLLNRDVQPAVAYRYALDGWNRLGSGALLQALLELGISQGWHAELHAVIRHAEKSGAVKNVVDAPYYWSLVAQVYRGVGQHRASMLSHRRAVLLAPNDELLAAGYIWLLLDLGQRVELRDVLRAWKDRERNMPELYDPFAAAHAQLGDYATALSFYRQRYAVRHSDPIWLAGYADALEQAGWPEQAYGERLKALQQLRKKMAASDFKVEAERRSLQQSHVRLSMLITPGEAADRQILQILREPQDQSSRELVAGWALSSGRSDLARIWCWNQFARTMRSPKWVELSLALEENDRPRLAKLLEHELDRLPYMDAIEAAQRTGRQGLAEQVLFERSTANSAGQQLYERLREIYGNNASTVDYRLNLADRGGIGAAENTLTISKRLSPRWRVLAEITNTDFVKLKSSSAGSLPYSEQRARLGGVQKFERGLLAANAGFRRALEDFAFADATAEYELSNRFRISGELHYAGRPTETAPLTMAGVRDMLAVASSYRLTPRDTISGRFTAFSLLDQNRRRLSNGQSAELELAHQINYAWPDWRVRTYGGYFNYRRQGNPQGKMLALVPQNADAFDYFIPRPFWQGGVGISFGYNGRYTYVKDWRLFGSADMLWNSNSRWGWNYAMGIHGPLFGFDKLFFSISQDSGSFGKSDMNTVFEIGYTYYFN
ncbi:MAG TPA: tetratricopeptide repeat protein [Deltaproteobacteria bacterium]|nr:tetratricopeptide repeat protein [Deltaproteobacteria bacterium]